MGHTIEKGSRELAKIRRELREITALVNAKLKAAGHRHLKMVKGEEMFGGSRDGYDVYYSLRDMKMKSGILRQVDLHIEVGAEMNHPGRTEVRCWTLVNIEIDKPVKHKISRGNSGYEFRPTFADDRPITAKAGVVFRTILEAIKIHDEAYAYVTEELRRWDAFADRVARLKKIVGFRKDKLQRDRRINSVDSYLEASLDQTQTRKFGVKIETNIDSKNVSLHLTGISEQKLKSVMAVIK
jgi:hypothetical protein